MENDWVILQYIFNFFYYFGITPFLSYNYNKRQIGGLRRFYVMILHVTFTFISLFQIGPRRNLLNNYMKKMGPTLDMIAIAMELIQFQTILCGSTYWQVKKWERIFRFINQDLAIYFKNKLNSYVINSSIRISNLQIFLFVFALLLLHCNDILSSRIINDEMYFIGTRINELYILFYTLLFVNFISFLKRRFNCINIYLVQLIKQKEAEERSALIKKIKDINTMYRKMNELISDLNEIFGFLIFLIIFYIFIRSVYWIALAMHPERMNHYFYVVILGYSSFFVVRKIKPQYLYSCKQIK